MSLPLDLDEHREADLKQELMRRHQAQQLGRCDYCGRRPDKPACKFPFRHMFSSKAKARPV